MRKKLIQNIVAPISDKIFQHLTMPLTFAALDDLMIIKLELNGSGWQIKTMLSIADSL